MRLHPRSQSRSRDRWLCDHAAPSALHREFPWLQLGKVARYYELGRGVEGEFIESWDRIEQFYREREFPPAAAVRAFVAEMRSRGYDRTLRAGQSLYNLMLSRSRRHGLRAGQPRIAFHFREQGMDVSVRMVTERTISVPGIELNAEVDALLKQLEAARID